MSFPTQSPRVWLLVTIALLAGAAGIVLAMRHTSDPADFSKQVVTDLNSASPHSTATAGAEPAKVGSLDALLPGLEAKASANPHDIGARLLLAQTYAELDRRADALRVLQALAAERPNDGQVRFIQGEILMRGQSSADLRAARDAFAAAARTYPEALHLARLHQGEAMLRLGDKPGALRVWREHMRTLAATDQHRVLFEDAIKAAAAPAVGS